MDRKLVRDKKIQFLKEAVVKFNNEFEQNLPAGTGFGLSAFFYFIPFEGKKYVYKDALKYLITDSPDIDKELDFTFDDIVNFLEDVKGVDTILPTYHGQSESFLIFDYLSEEDGWIKVEALNENDARVIRTNTRALWRKKSKVLSPFYSHLFRKIVKNETTGDLKIIDLKYLEMVKRHPIALYMNESLMNKIYLLERNFNPFYSYQKMLSRDYPSAEADIFKLYK